MKHRNVTLGLILLISLAAALLVLLQTSQFGTGLTPDSALYISTARNVAAGRGYVQYDGAPLVMWAPLYPTLLALARLAGADPIPAARYLNALGFGLIVLVAGLWIRRNVRSLPFAGLGAAAVFLSVPVQEVSSFAWSEPWFILAGLLSLYQLQRFFEGGSRASLVLAAACGALAFLTRYIGVTMILTGGIMLLLRRDQKWQARLTDLATFGVVALAPVVAWLARNHAVSGTWLGERIPSSTTLGQNLALTLDIISAWFLPDLLPSALRSAVTIALLVGVVAGVLRCAQLDRRSGSSAGPHPVLPVLGFLALYSAWLLGTVSTIGLTPLDTRYWSPAYVPLVLCAVWTLEQMFTARARQAEAAALPRPSSKRKPAQSPGTPGAGPGRTPVLPAAVAAAACLLLAKPLLDTIGNVRFARANGYFRDARLVSDSGRFARIVAHWQDSPLLRDLAAQPLQGSIYASNPVPFYRLCSVSMGLLPIRPRELPDGYTTEGLIQFEKALRAQGSACVVWLTDSEHLVYGPDALVYSVEELKSFCDVQLLAAHADGAVYRVTSRETRLSQGPATEPPR